MVSVFKKLTLKPDHYLLWLRSFEHHCNCASNVLLRHQRGTQLQTSRGHNGNTAPTKKLALESLSTSQLFQCKDI